MNKTDLARRKCREELAIEMLEVEPWKHDKNYPKPPKGFITSVIEHNLSTAKRRQPALALFGAIALQATLSCRRVRSDLGARPNLSIVALAGTTSGKNRAREINTEILKRADAEALSIGDDFTSDIALYRSLEPTGSGLSQIDEVGRVFANSSRIGTREHAVVTSIMKLATSENDSSCKPKSYADLTRNVSLCCPCLNLYGTGTPEAFFESIGSGSVDDGFLGRLIVVRGTENVEQEIRPDTEVPSEIIELAKYWFNRAGNLPTIDQGKNIPNEIIVKTEPEAVALLSHFTKKADNLTWIGGHNRIWGRAVEKASKLSLVYACSENPIKPVITKEAVRWGIAIVERTTSQMVEDCHNWLAGSLFQKGCNEIYRIIWACKKHSCTQTELCMIARKWKSKDRAEFINALTEQGRLTVRQIKTAGRPQYEFEAMKS
jgi:hypothetical protein